MGYINDFLDYNFRVGDPSIFGNTKFDLPTDEKLFIGACILTASLIENPFLGIPADTFCQLIPSIIRNNPDKVKEAAENFNRSVQEESNSNPWSVVPWEDSLPTTSDTIQEEAKSNPYDAYPYWDQIAENQLGRQPTAEDIENVKREVWERIKEGIDIFNKAIQQESESNPWDIVPWDYILPEDYSMKWWEEIQEDFQRHKDYSKGSYAIYDPIVLDLDGDGMETVSSNSYEGALFDFDGNGIRNATGWVNKDDGILVFDRNSDGIINDGTEIFGDSALLSNAEKAEHGFAALSDLDSNSDGKITSEDTNFDKLKVWQDINGDGISQANELLSLSELGIRALNINYKDTNKDLGNGNKLTQEAYFEKEDGTTGQMGDVNLALLRSRIVRHKASPYVKTAY